MQNKRESAAANFIHYSLSSALSLETVRNPSGTQHRILRRADGKSTLPGQPWVKVSSDKLLDYLRRSFLTPDIDKVVPHLWLIATPSRFNITPLHHQSARGREIIVTEHPGLHGVWYHDKIFIQPIPPYFFCGDFWEYIKVADDRLFKSMAGFMRSYCHLIQYETDFKQATSPALQLVPAVDGNVPTFEDFVSFLSQFQDLPNSEVSPRYSYGFLRLSRLNILAPIFMGKLTYFHLYPQWKDNLARFIAPVLTLFAVLTTLLNCMQVTLAAQTFDLDLAASGSWPQFLVVCRWFPVAIIIFVIALLAFVFVFLLVMVVKTRLAASLAVKAGGAAARDPLLPGKHVSVAMHGNQEIL